MVNEYYRRIPKYYDDSDYNTNAPSYYDDLARKSKLIKLLSERIWEYDEELAKRFEAWDQNLEDFPEDVKTLLQNWINDGTIDQIINETLFQQKPDRSEMMELFNLTSKIETSETEPTDERVDYWFEKKNEFSIIDGTNPDDSPAYSTNVYVGDSEPSKENVWLNT